MGKNRTEISEYGEFGLIRHLTEKIQLKNSSSRIGVGDDAAVLDYTDKEVLVTNDLLLEGIHFDLTYTPMMHLGYKSAIVNFSDIYAMNGQPKQIIVSMGISKRFCVEDLEDFYEGLQTACDKYGVDLVGGDTSASLTGLMIEHHLYWRSGKRQSCFAERGQRQRSDIRFRRPWCCLHGTSTSGKGKKGLRQRQPG